MSNIRSVLLGKIDTPNTRWCSFDEFLNKVGAPSRHEVNHSPSKYFEAQFWDLEESPLPELEDVLKENLPTLNEARIVVSGNTGEIECRVLLVLNKPRRITYCDLAIIVDGKHQVEPWSIDAMETLEGYDGRYRDGVEGLVVVKP